MKAPVAAFLIAFAILSLDKGFSQTVLTVREAEFRSRWEGRQEDREVPEQYFDPGGGLGNEGGEQVGEPIGEDESQKRGLTQSIDQMADNFRRGLRFGPLDFQLGLATGWEYSSQDSVGGTTDFNNCNSFYAAPTIAVVYEREVGLWSVSTRYSAGYKYYFNQDYTAAGTGNQRNPLSMTAGIDIGYNTSRLAVSLTAGASMGSGYDPVAGANNWQSNISTGLSVRYIISEEFSFGGAVSGTYSNAYGAQVAAGDTPQPDSNTISAGASLFADYLVTPKTNLRLILSAGQDLQDLSQGLTQGRRFLDSMLLLTYQLAPKLSVDAGGGVGFVLDQNIPDPQYTGVRPVYTVGVNYTPTQKTYFKANFGMQGTDIRPNFSLLAGWDVREKTRLSLSLYQNQSFSSLSSNQYNITRGVLGTVAQQLLKGINVTFSGGYEQSRYIALTSQKLNNVVQGPSSYWMANASLYWRIREWLAWQNTFTVSTGQANNEELQTRFDTSFNFNF
ncbi:MAG: hypothetical protein WCG66_12235 [bacterium]